MTVRPDDRITEPTYDAAFRARLLRQGLANDEMAQFVEAVEAARAFLLAYTERLETALTAASEDARILVQDYYSGLPEHRAPVDGAVARLAHLFERDDDTCGARTVDEIVTDGLAARAALVPSPPDVAA